MKNKTIYLTFLLLSFLSCKIDTKTQYLEKQKNDKIDSLANRYLELNRFSGTITVVKDYSIIYNQSFGLADYETNVSFSNKTAFKIGEITEIITANIIYQLVKQEKIELTHKVSKYLPENKSDFTINDVLNRNANTDYNTLGKIIEKVSDKTYEENIEEYSDNLELENTYFKKTDAPTAVGYLYHNYRGKGLELQKSPNYDLENAFSSNGLKSTGNDLVKILKSNPRELKINGYLENDGFSYSLVNDTKNGISIIVLSNQRHPVANEISGSINAILEDRNYRLPLLREQFDISKTSLKDFSGSYSINENASFEVLNSNDSLFVLMGPNKIHLIPQSSNQFYMEQMDASMRFMKDSTNAINRVILLNGFIDSDEQASRIK